MTTKAAHGRPLAVAHVLVLGAFLIFALYQAKGAAEKQSVTIALLLINGGFSIAGQVIALKGKSPLAYVSFTFCYLFMAVAPLIQVGASLDPVFDLNRVAPLAALSGLGFTVAGLVLSRHLLTGASREQSPARDQGGRYLALFIVTTGVGLLAAFIYRGDLFTSREGFALANSRLFADAPTALLASTCLTSIPFFGAAIGLRAAVTRGRLGWTAWYLVAFAIAMVLNNPLIQPRFKLVGIAVFLIDYVFRKRRMQLLALVMVVGVVVAPAFNVFRAEESSATSSTPASPDRLFDETFLSYDYDAFQTSCYAIVTAQASGFSLGSNIVGALLFFVPRAIWIGKPEPTSFILFRTMERYREVGTENLSTPLMAEGYFAFGIIGALGISVIYWLIVVRLDVKSRQHEASLFFLCRCVAAGLVLIFLRGTLIVGVSFVAGSLFSATVPWLIFRLPVSRTASTLAAFRAPTAISGRSRTLRPDPA